MQLFRTNRYVGADRLSDANQISVGVTSRLLDAENGKQFISGTIGQAYYFDEPRVALPGEVLEDPEFSDIIAELDVTAFGDWNVGMGVQWDPSETRSEKGDVQVQYKPEFDRVSTSATASAAAASSRSTAPWPGRSATTGAPTRAWCIRWRTIHRWTSSPASEYRSCCWRIRAVARRYVSDRTGDTDTSFLLQLELNGLSSVGVGADAFLERSIRGYSAGPPEP